MHMILIRIYGLISCFMSVVSAISIRNLFTRISAPCHSCLHIASRSARGFTCAGLLVFGSAIDAEEGAAGVKTDDVHDRIENVLVIGSQETVAGAGTTIDAEALDQFDYVDINQVLSNVPGVYVREEDGYGLRPNIGIRGAAAERSLKITLMEDGVLIAPAPYSAPAAYYVPNISRIDKVEVLKGPAAIRTGPHTVGGAINFVTRDTPPERLRELDVSYGSDDYYKVQSAVGGPLGDGDTSILLEALSYGSSGFKILDTGGDTGFIRNDFNVKLQWQPGDDSVQQFTVKFAFANEDADETYLGLTDTDFREQATRRYASSQMARFTSDHFNLHLNHGFSVGDGLVNTKAYWHRFERSWNKLDGFVKGRALQSILTRPHLFIREYELLTGVTNSLAVDSQTFEITNNDRGFTSAGVQSAATASVQWGSSQHDFTIGLRLHHDKVARDHQPRGYLMTDRQLVWDGTDRAKKSWNRASSWAGAAFASDEITWHDVKLTLGLRIERIHGEFEDLNLNVARDNQQTEVSPGGGVFWQVSDSFGLLAGVYKGFSPAGPGATNVAPEQSVNLEFGIRHQQPASQLEAVAFHSDYGNLLGRCRVSDAGCDAGQAFNGGEVRVHGAEFTYEWAREYGDGLRLYSGLAYTYTESAFQSSFLSGFSQWGLVRENDELPYLPRHRASLQLGLGGNVWDVAAVIKRQSAMREEPGSGPIESGLYADEYTTADFTATFHARHDTLLQLVVGNAFDKAAIVSHRPFGARPNRPRWLTVRVRTQF